MPNSTAETLRLAATIADRLERRGEPCTVEDAIARAEAAHLQLAQLKELRDSDWANTQPMPPLPAGVSLSA